MFENTVSTEVLLKLLIFSSSFGVDAPSQMLKLILAPNLEVDLDALHKTFQLLL